MRRFSIIFACGCCIGCILLMVGCSSDENITGSDPIASLDDIRVELPCTGDGNAQANCTTPESDEVSATLVGDEGVTYEVTIRLRGLVEQRTYTGWIMKDEMWIAGGTPAESSFNIFRIQISSPFQIYYLNAGSSGIDHCFLMDIQKTILMDHSATITLYAGSGGDGLSTKNMDDQGNPIIVSGVPPYPDPFDGQFVQIDVQSFAVPDG
ncbi:MAG: hypothetical protein KOO63_13725 [Bacteroidales bacterium]|nr:hypothetical protein [Candidatus Latescibacterota bacterium]